MILRRKQLGGFGDGVGGALTAGVTTAFREFCHIKQPREEGWGMGDEG